MMIVYTQLIMDPQKTTDLELQLARMEGTIDEMHKDIRRMKMYASITFWGGILIFIIPLIALPFVLSTFFSTYLNSLSLGTNPSTASSGNAGGISGTNISNADIQNALNSLGF